MNNSSWRLSQLLRFLEQIPQAEASSELTLANAMLRTDFFDCSFYVQAYPDIQEEGIDPALHFLRHGFREGRRPGPWASQMEVAELAAKDVRPGTDFREFLKLWEKKSSMPEPQKPSAADTKAPLKRSSRGTPSSPTVMRQGSIYALYGGQLHVDWYLTHMCNYRCSYCFSHDRTIDRKKFCDWDDLKRAVDHLDSINRPAYKFTLSGGEPTIHPEFFRLIEYLAERLGERLNYILIISNGSRQGKLYEKLAQLAEGINLNMLVSLHTEYANAEHIEELIRKLADKMSITFNLMFNPERRGFTRQLHQMLCEMRREHAFCMNIALLRMPPAFDVLDKRYEEEDFAWRQEALERFKEATKASEKKFSQRCRFPESIYIEYERDGIRKYEALPYEERDSRLQQGFYNFKNMSCIHGSSVVTIGDNGMVKGAQCPQADFKYNIYKENPFHKSDFTKSVICRQQNCGCSANDSIPKFRDKAEAANFINARKLLSK